MTSTSNQNQTSKVIQNFMKGESDPLLYRIVKLSNGITGLLIQDEETSKSSVAAVMHIGSLRDFEDFQGVAHFLEHMLFMGSEKYPDHEHFEKYVANNGGSFNAYTSQLMTNYFFDCKNDGFFEGLDIFSEFFKKPLLAEEWVNKEVNAVNSEAQMYLKNDFWREFQLLFSLSKKDSLLQKYNVGNLETLKKEGLIEALRKFYNTYYSANQMAVVINAPFDLDTQQAKLEEHFGTVPNKEIKYSDFKDEDYPYGPEQLGKFVKICPIQDKDTLKIVFPLPSQYQNRYDRIEDFWSHLIGHESEGSIDHLLKTEGLITSLSAGDYIACEDLTTYIVIGCQLTKKGLANYSRVVEVVGSYIRMLVAKGPQQETFDELKRIGEMKFRFAESSQGMNQCMNFAARIFATEGDEEKLRELQYRKFAWGNFNKEALTEFIGQMTPENMILVLSSQSLKEETTLKETYYQTPYMIEDLSQEIIDLYNKGTMDWKTSALTLHLPEENTLIPDNFDLLQAQGDEQVTKVREVPDSVLWHLQDATFNKPRVQFEARIYHSHKNMRDSTESQKYQDLWTLCYEQEMQTLNYMCELANSRFRVSGSLGGLIISGRCYSETFAPYLKKLPSYLEKFNSFDNEELFNNKLQQVIQGMKGSLTQPPYRQALTYLRLSLQERRAQVTQEIEVLETLTFEGFKQWRNSFLSKVRFEWLIQGNITSEKASEVVATFEENIKTIYSSTLMTKSETYQLRNVKMSPNQTWILEPTISLADEKNSGFIKSFQLGQGFDAHFAPSSWLASWLHQEYFDELRSNQNLGYVVFAYMSQVRGVYYFNFCVQSDVKISQEIEGLTADFLIQKQKKLSELSQEDFDKIIEGSIAKNEQKFANMGERFNAHLTEVQNHMYRFNKKELKVAALKGLKKDEVIAYYAKYLIDEACALEIHAQSPVTLEDSVKIRNQRVEASENVRICSCSEDYQKRLETYADKYALLE